MSRRTTIRIPDDLYARLAERAKAERRTVSNLVIFLLSQSLNVATSVSNKPETGDTAQPGGE
jgi:predicted transcriptional regulator